VDVIGNGNLGADDGDYQTATFDHPQGMTLVGDHLYVADTENHLIRMVDLKERKVTRAAGTGKQAREYLSGGPTRTTALNSPWALTHLDDTLFIAMAGPHQLWSHKLGSGRLNVFAGNGREDIIDGPRENASLAQPSGLTNDGKSLYFVDSEGSAVRSVGLEKNGVVTTIAGTHDLPSGRSLFEFGDVDGTGDAARLQHPLGVLFHDGSLFVADSYNHKIKLVDPATRKCTTWLGTGKPGTGLAPVELSEPADIAVIDNTMIIADTNNHRLLRIDLQTKQAEEFVIEGLEPPPPATFDSSTDDDEPIVKLEPQSVRPGDELTIELTTELPEGFKLNPLAPQTCRLGSGEKQSLVAEDNLNVKLEGVSEGHTVRWTVPLVEKSGSATFELKVSYSYCRDGTGGVCRFGTARWEVPVRVAPDATASAVSLKVSPPK
jgi:hypothetical protein